MTLIEAECLFSWFRALCIYWAYDSKEDEPWIKATKNWIEYQIRNSGIHRDDLERAICD